MRYATLFALLFLFGCDSASDSDVLRGTYAGRDGNRDLRMAFTDGSGGEVSGTLYVDVAGGPFTPSVSYDTPFSGTYDHPDLNVGMGEREQFIATVSDDLSRIMGYFTDSQTTTITLWRQ